MSYSLPWIYISKILGLLGILNSSYAVCMPKTMYGWVTPKRRNSRGLVINSLMPGDIMGCWSEWVIKFSLSPTVMWCGRFWSTLVQVMAWCLMAPSHYLNQCWLIVNWTQGLELQWKINQYTRPFILENAFENVICKLVAILFRPQSVNGDYPGQHWVYGMDK